MKGKNNDSFKFPVSAPKKSFLGKFKLLIGSLILSLKPELISKFEKGIHPATKTERWALSYLISELKMKGDMKRLSNLHAMMWSNPEYVQYHENIIGRNRKGYELLKDDIYMALKELTSGENAVSKLVEFGCGNGWLINQLSNSEKIPAIKYFLGIDINEAQVNKNNIEYQENEKLDFLHGEINTWLNQEEIKHTVFLSFGGVLEYLNGEQFEDMISLISKSSHTALIVFEPIADAKKMEEVEVSTVFGGELSFSHPYLQAIKKSHLQLLTYKTIRWIGNDWVFLVARRY